MTNLDLIITLGTFGTFAFLVWRKRKKKKESEEVQTSELSPLPTKADVTTLPLSGNGALTAYPKGAQVEVVTFNFRDFQNMEHLASSIDAKLNRLLLESANADRVPMLQYITVGTTLVVVCVHTL